VATKSLPKLGVIKPGLS